MIKPANVLGSNGFNGLGFDMDCIWMDSNELYQLMGWGGFYVNIDWSGLG